MSSAKRLQQKRRFLSLVRKGPSLQLLPVVLREGIEIGGQWASRTLPAHFPTAPPCMRPSRGFSSGLVSSSCHVSGGEGILLATKFEGSPEFSPFFTESIRSGASSEINSMRSVSICDGRNTAVRHLIRTYCVPGAVRSSKDRDEQDSATVCTKWCRHVRPT